MCIGFNSTTDRANLDEGCIKYENGTVYEKACREAVVQQVEDNAQVIGISAIVIGSLQIVCFIIACCLVKRIPTKEEKEKALLDEARQLNREAAGQPGGYQSTTPYTRTV